MAYLKERTRDEVICLLVRLSSKCADLGGPLSRQLFNLVRDERYLDVINFHIDYTWVFSTNDFLYSRQIMGFFEKQDFLDLGIDKEAVAVAKFHTSEDLCRETNKRLELNASLNKDVNAVLYYASQKIAKILGDVPSIDSLDLSFGPGATTSTKSLIACHRTKLSSRLECGMNLAPLVRDLLEELPMLAMLNESAESICTPGDRDTFGVDVRLVPGKLAFVPKNCKTFRSIVVEPILNGLIQKGIGKVMKQRLLNCGLDLSDQTRNQRLAQVGSLSGSLATIDLSMASDCVSRELVWSLLPYDWSVLLDQCRSAVVKHKKHLIMVEKFSSMGNAYTFELETLLFYALTYATCLHLKVSDRDVSVYGDDIIVPTKAFGLLSEVLSYCGFALNKTKSFSEGPFRESCGADYLNGMDIRPFYLKSMVNDRVLYSMHNWFIRHCEFELANLVHNYTNPEIRLYGPDGFGDGHLIGQFELQRNRLVVRAGWEGGTFKTYVLGPKSFKLKLPGDYLFPLYAQYVRSRIPPGMEIEESDMFRIRGTRSYKVKSIYTLATRIFSSDVHSYALAADMAAELNEEHLKYASS
jgi:hypothetical protein